MISIIIPTYNAEQTITCCLESIFAQTYQDFEIIVVNDGSTDHTLSVIEKLISRLRNREINIRIVSQKNQGANAARNRGFVEIENRHPERSEGSLHPGMASVSHKHGEEISRFARNDNRFVLFCDADLILRPDMLEKMVQTLKAHPEASYAYSSFKFGWKTFKLWPFDAERLRRMPYIHTTSLIRREHFPGFDERVKRLQDWDLWLTMLEQGNVGFWIPEVLFRVVNTQGTMSQWIPSFLYKIPWKWLRIQSRAVTRYNEAVARIKAKHKPG